MGSLVFGLPMPLTVRFNSDAGLLIHVAYDFLLVFDNSVSPSYIFLTFNGLNYEWLKLSKPLNVKLNDPIEIYTFDIILKEWP